MVTAYHHKEPKALQIGDRSRKRANFAPPWVMVCSVGGDNTFVEYFFTSILTFDYQVLITKMRAIRWR